MSLPRRVSRRAAAVGGRRLGTAPRPSPRVVGCPQRARKRAPEHERRGAVGVRRGEEDAHGRSLDDAEQRRSRRAGRVHHRAKIVHALLERRCAGDVIGHSGSALVEEDQTSELRELEESLRHRRNRPAELDVGDEPGDEDEIEGAVADDLVGDRYVSAPRVVRLRPHARSLTARRAANAAGGVGVLERSRSRAKLHAECDAHPRRRRTAVVTHRGGSR